MTRIEAEKWRITVTQMQVRWFAGYIERQARRVLKDFG
jgi:hypothetical protein